MTMRKFFAPPSACTRLWRATARSWILRATADEPTNDTAANARVVHERFDRFDLAVHDVEDAFRKTALGGDPGEHVRGERRLR